MYLRPTPSRAGNGSHPTAVDSWHTSQIRVKGSNVAVPSPPPFSGFASFRRSTDSSVSSAPPTPTPVRPPRKATKAASPPKKRHPYATNHYAGPSTPVDALHKPLPYQGATLAANEYRHSYAAGWDIAPPPPRGPPPPMPEPPLIRLEQQVLPDIFRRRPDPPPAGAIDAARLFHPAPLHLHNALPTLPVPPSPTPDEASSEGSYGRSEDSHVEQATFVTGHRRETMSVSSARAFTPVATAPKLGRLPMPMPVPTATRVDQCASARPDSPLPPPPSRAVTFSNRVPSLVLDEPLSGGSTMSSPKVFTPNPETFSNRIPSKASKLLGLVPTEEDREDLVAPKPGFGFGFGMTVSGSPRTRVGLHYHGHSSEGGSMSSTGSLPATVRGRPDEAAAYEARRRPSHPPPPPPTRPLPHPLQTGLVPVERGGGVIASKAKLLLGIRTESERIIRTSPPRPPRSPALLSYMRDSDDDDDSEDEGDDEFDADSSWTGSATSIGSENPFRRSFALVPLLPLGDPTRIPALELVIPPSPTPFGSLFSGFDFADYPMPVINQPSSNPSRLRGIPSGFADPAYRESSLMPDDPPPPMSRHARKGSKNVKGLVLASTLSDTRRETVGDVRRRLKKSKSHSRPAVGDRIDEEGDETEVGEAKLRPAGAPPVRLGRMDVATPTENMARTRRTPNHDSATYLASIPSMILPRLAQNPALQPVTSPYVTYPLARSDSQRDYPTSPSNSSSADHHYQVQHELAPRTPELPSRARLGAGLRTWTEESEQSRKNGGGWLSSSEEGHASEASRGTFGAKHRRRS